MITVCLYFAWNKDFISCFKGHNVKACPLRDVPPLQNLRVWGGHRSSVSAFTATAFGVRFTVGDSHLARLWLSGGPTRSECSNDCLVENPRDWLCCSHPEKIMWNKYKLIIQTSCSKTLKVRQEVHYAFFSSFKEMIISYYNSENCCMEINVHLWGVA